MRSKIFRILLFTLTLTGLSFLTGGTAYATDYSNSRLMDDQIFDNVGTMNEAQIQSFLASKGPCLANYQDVDPNWTGSAWTYSGSVPASHIIYKAAQQWGLNPQVIIATLQKEESLITGTACDQWRYNSAMGYGCPDSGGCNPKYVGFTRQVLWGAWQLKFNKERAYGNTAWDGDGDITYVGLMTQGDRKRCTTCATITYDGNATIDGQLIHMDNGTTASLYTYTPHLGQTFPGWFETWFGPALTPNYGSQYAAQCTYPTIQAGSSASCFISYKNQGNQPWYDDSSATGASARPVHLATSHDINRNSMFGSTWGGDQNRATGMFAAVYEADGVTLAPNQHVTEAGQIAKFAFTLSPPSSITSGVYREYFQPIVEGGSSMNDPGTFLDITVTDLAQSAYASESVTPVTIKPGQKASNFIAYKNTGNIRWCDDVAMVNPNVGCKRIHLATSHAINRASILGGDWGGDRNRPSMNFSAVYLADGSTLAADQHTALPGQIAKFSFNFSVPAGQAASTLREYFQPIVEGGSTMNDPGTFLDVTIPSASTASAQSVAAQQMVAGSTRSLTASIINTGNTTWTPANTMLMSANANAQIFHSGNWTSNTVVSPLNEGSVAPGSTGTFNLSLLAPMSSGSYSPVFMAGDGTTIFDGNAVQFTVQVQTASFSSAYSSQSAYPQIRQGQTSASWLRYKNTGNVAWYDDASYSAGPSGTKPVHLATSHGINRRSSLGLPWGGDQNRAALSFNKVYEADGATLATNQHIVQPGQIAEFAFTFAAPFGQSPASYREYFQPIVEGGTVMNDPGTFLDVTVLAGNYASQYFGQSAYPTITRPASGSAAAPAYFLYKNVGNVPWYDGTSAPVGSRPTVLATSHAINRSSALADASWCNPVDRNRAACTFAAVYELDGTTLASNQHMAQPGQIVKFAFSFSASSTSPLGTSREFFQPIVEGGTVMNDPGTFLDVTVQ